MGEVDLHFKPRVPVFDACVSLGRKHDRRVKVWTVGDTIGEMDRTGVDRALVYAPHAAAYDSLEGNQILLDDIKVEARLVPQFCCNPTFDNLDSFAAGARDAAVKTIRLFPKLHNYPFREWVVGPWLDWAEEDGIAVWIPVAYETNWHPAVDVDPHELYESIKGRPKVNFVLAEVKYADYPWAMPLLRALPNLSVEISRFVIVDAVGRLMRTVGDRRILFGSRFPESEMGPQLYNLHHNDLSDDSLKLICAGNLERLTGRG